MGDRPPQEIHEQIPVGQTRQRIVKSIVKLPVSADTHTSHHQTQSRRHQRHPPTPSKNPKTNPQQTHQRRTPNQSRPRRVLNPPSHNPANHRPSTVPHNFRQFRPHLKQPSTKSLKPTRSGGIPGGAGTPGLSESLNLLIPTTFGAFS